MKNQIHPSSCSEARLGDARSIICHRRGTWPGPLLAGCCAVLIGLAWPTRAAVTEAWVHRYNSVVSNSIDGAANVVVDAAGDIIVAGSTDDGLTGSDMLTIKYSGADGSVIWQQRYNGPGTSQDSASDVAADASGNVVVTGTSNGDYYTAKYAAANGALLWEKRYNGPANSDDRAHAMAVDSSGNVVVTGSFYSGSSIGIFEYYTAKYAAASGALLWEKGYDSPSSFDEAKAVAVDGSGNVVVTRSSYNGTNSDYYTAKYAAANGALLWEKRYNGPGNGEDIASSLALGPSGMIAVTGSSSGDYATVVYRENLPPIFIEIVPAGVRLRFVGIPDRSYNIERAPAVAGPWSTIATPTAPAGGLIEYIDTTPLPGSAFYRTVQP